MTLPVVLRDQAAEDLLVACDYLEARQAGLSVRLIAEVKRVVNRISAHPELHDEMGDGSDFRGESIRSRP